MARRLVKNRITDITAEFDSIRAFGDFMFPYLSKDPHDNWFYQNLSNISQEEYIRSENKDDLIFEFHEYIISKL
jgi:hypothetical protein